MTLIDQGITWRTVEERLAGTSSLALSLQV